MKSLIVFCVALAVSAPAYAARVFVNRVTGVGVAESDCAVIEEIMRATVREHRESLATSDRQADYLLHGKVMKLGQVYLFSVEKRKENEVLFSSEMRAEQLEDMDRVARRVTQSAMEERNQANTKIADVTETELGENSGLRIATRHYYVGFGPSGGVNLDSDNVLVNLSLAYAWDVKPTVALRVYWDGVINPSHGDSGLHTLGLGGSYYFNERDISPFADAAFGFGFADAGSKGGGSVSGFMSSLGAGYRFFRTSNVNLELVFRYTFLFRENSLGIPSAYGIRLGFYF